MKNLLTKVSGAIIGFWVVSDDDLENPSYKDFPISPFGNNRLISPKTLKGILEKKK